MIRGRISGFLWCSVMGAFGFKDGHHRRSSQLSFDGYQFGALKPLEGAIFGVAIETKAYVSKEYSLLILCSRVVVLPSAEVRTTGARRAKRWNGTIICKVESNGRNETPGQALR
jgi:hypothetical protein